MTYAVVFLLLVIPEMPEQVSDALIGICLAATVFAFVGYVAFYAEREGPYKMTNPRSDRGIFS